MRGRKRKSLSRKHPKNKDPLEVELDHYSASESENELGPDGKIMLERARHGKFIQDESEEEVLRVRSSEDSEEEDEEGGLNEDFYGGNENEVGSDFDSDIEGKGESKGNEFSGLPSSKAWGSKKRRFYDTDYIDQDFGGMGQNEEEEALMEEEEAKAIQKRMMSELEGADITLGLLDKVAEKKEQLAKKVEIEGGEIIEKDLSSLSKEEQIRFIKTESPEFFPLVEDFKERMSLVINKLDPILEMAKTQRLPQCKASDAITLFKNIILVYCMNVSHYLLLKSMRVRVDGHPILGRLVSLRRLLKEIDSGIWCPSLGKKKSKTTWKGLQDSVNSILHTFDSLKGNSDFSSLSFEFENLEERKFGDISEGNRAQRRKKKLKLIQEMKKIEEKVEEKRKEFEKEEIIKEGILKSVRFKESESSADSEEEGGLEEEESGEKIENVQYEEVGSEEEQIEGDKGEENRRGITYDIAKNKGLTPRKRKELRNPRVKLRNKFKKAKKRRKGQIREVRNELSRYGGEISGVKAYLSKSIKLK